MRRSGRVCLSMALAWVLAVPVHALVVVSTSPVTNELGAATGAPIIVTFDRPVDRSSVVAQETFWAFGRWSGTATGVFGFGDGDRSVTLVPDRPFSAGETVLVVLSNALRGADGSSLRAAGYSYPFWTRARPAGARFVEVDRLSTRTSPLVSSRAYGGFGSDLDGDGHLDLTIVNEDTDDLRVFLNRADGSGLVADFLQPTFGTGGVPSPAEPADFDRDGNVDVAVANTQGGSVSILLGLGDGRFAPQQEIVVSSSPRGIAVLDADGDGDLDVVSANPGADDLSLLRNDGTGVFGAAMSFGAGTSGSWGLAAADFDEDGVLDLVVGAQDAAELRVLRGLGGGSFATVGDFPVGGAVWMLAVGDVDGDGHVDVASVNSGANNGAILFGDGTGQLGAPSLHATDGFPLASDLGDIDGDGDLDWMVSSFSGDWQLFTNDGTGQFVFARRFEAPRAASCALMLDLDRDGDLDLALIDELEDELVLLHNRGFADGFESGDTIAWTASVP